MISRFKAVWLVVFAALTVVLLVGCNDALRQFILPIPQPGGDTCIACLSHAVVLSQNPTGNGSTMHINVTGDSNVGVLSLGPNPLFLAKGGNRVFVVNSDQTLSSYFGLAVGGTSSAINPNTITLPPTVSGPIAGAISSTGDFFLAESGSGKVNQISAGAQAVIATLPVGTTPVFVVGSVRNSKIYVVNQGSNNVTVISTTDNTILGNITVGTSPVWGVMSDDGAHAYIVNQGSGTVSAIDTQLDTVIATIAVGASAGSSPNFAVYDAKNQRVWVNNSGENSVSVIKANDIDLTVSPQVLPRKIADITLSAAPTNLTVLADGTRAYAALGGCVSGTNHINLIGNIPGCTGNRVSVIDALGLVETGVVTVAPGAVSIDSSADSSRVYVVGAHDTTVIKDNMHNPSCTASPCTTTGGGCIALPCLPGAPLPDRTFQTPSLSIIRTATNTVFRPPSDVSVSSTVPSFYAPQQDFKCVAVTDPNFNKTVPLPCPVQNPFMVRVIP
jgi:YVTN family beta-propeller protein